MCPRNVPTPTIGCNVINTGPFGQSYSWPTENKNFERNVQGNLDCLTSPLSVGDGPKTLKGSKHVEK